jgi:SpoVK/Ycf46/Vps4 family AAA+-type ATPase
MFASRHYADLQERFQERLGEPGRQIVLYGDTGVGKTSLVRYVCETQEIKMVYVECGLRFEEMLKEALAKAGITEERFEGIDQKSTHAGVRGTLLALYAGGRHDIEDKYVTTSYPVSVQTAIREALTVEGFKVLFLDNFENLQPREYRDEVATEIVQLMKSFSDRSGGVKVVVAGIPSESEALLSLDDATGRRTAQREVPRMPDEELDEILRKGEPNSASSSTRTAERTSSATRTASRTTPTCTLSTRSGRPSVRARCASGSTTSWRRSTASLRTPT